MTSQLTSQVDAARKAGATPMRYRRVLLKVSGEVLMGEAAFGIDMPTLDLLWPPTSPRSPGPGWSFAW